jgi:DNA polymerase-3 subunit gamma/tau
LALVHFITRIKLAPESANDIAYSENERTFGKELAQKLPITALTKAWQMLLKGLQETRTAPEPDSAAEMVLIRIAHSADLPSPSDLIRIIKKQDMQGTAPIGSHSSVVKSPVSLITTQQTIAQPAMPPAPSVSHVPMPQAFEEAAQMFNMRREVLLYNYLMRNSRLVQYEKGRIELNVSSEVPVDFAGRVGKCLTEWTGQRWVVILSHATGEAPLQEQLDSADSKKRDEVKSHPLVAAVLEQFPGAEVTKIITKE